MKDHKSVSLAILLTGLLFNTLLSAQESSDEYKEKDVIHFAPVVVTADRIEVPLDRVSSSVTLLTAELIEARQLNTISDVLRNVSGVDIVRSGSRGKITSLFLRGTNSNHTLVMLDGVLLNDPLNGGFDYSTLNSDNIKSIELVRGAQSTLYGSDAIGGILNIFTKRGSRELKFSLSSEAGDFGTFKESGSLSGGNDLVDYSLSISQFDTDGLFKNDDYSSTTTSLLASFKVNNDVKLTLSNRYSDSEGGTPGQLLYTFDPNARTANIFKATSILLKQKVSSKWHYKLNLARSEGDIDFDNSIVEGDLNPFGADSSNLKSSISSIDWQHDLHLNRSIVLTFGTSWEEREGKRNSKLTNFNNLTNTRSIYLQNHLRISDDFNLTAGVRTDNHTTFGNNTNYRLTSAYIFTRPDGGETKLRGSIGTGFRTPSINELSWPGYGNIDLDPEESKSIEVGIDQRYSDDKYSFSVDLFKLDFKNLIGFSSSCFCAENIKEAESSGIEIRSAVTVNESITASGNYTFLDTEDKSTGDPLLRRPKNSGGFNLALKFAFPLHMNFGVRMIGERLDSDFVDFPTVYNFLPSYQTLRIATSYEITEQFRLKLRIENLLDEQYEEVAGYSSPGRAVYGGIVLNL